MPPCFFAHGARASAAWHGLSFGRGRLKDKVIGSTHAYGNIRMYAYVGGAVASAVQHALSFGRPRRKDKVIGSTDARGIIRV